MTKAEAANGGVSHAGAHAAWSSHGIRSFWGYGIRSCAPLLKKCVTSRPEIFDSQELTGVPVAQFYDLDLLDQHFRHCATAFGPHFHHFIAIKSSSISKLLQHCYRTHDFGIECASLGEVLHAHNHCGVPYSRILFDSPCKTQKELEFSIVNKIHCNLDNYDEFARAKTLVEEKGLFSAKTKLLGDIGFRINPLVGAGAIAALSVSTKDSKFGVPNDAVNHGKLLDIYRENPWLNSVHVHVGSGGNGLLLLAAGIRQAVDFALAVNKEKKQIVTIDIGGGLPVNYWGDSYVNAEKKIPDFTDYAAFLQSSCPELFSGEFKVCTEFGQSLMAKQGFLASRIEWMKGTVEDGNRMCISHIGADCCPRQAYGAGTHERRVEVYKEDGEEFDVSENRVETSAGGPLCFQGDFIAKNVALPATLKARDILVLKDGGSNTLSLFSRHCSRLCPPVYGFRWANFEAQDDVTTIVELKPRETVEQLSNFWGPAATA